MLLGEPPERFDLAPQGIVVREAGHGRFSCGTRRDSEVVLFAYGAPPVAGQAEMLDDVEL